MEIQKTRLPCLFFFILHWEEKVGEGYNLGLIERNGSCQMGGENERKKESVFVRENACEVSTRFEVLLIIKFYTSLFAISISYFAPHLSSIPHLLLSL